VQFVRFKAKGKKPAYGILKGNTIRRVQGDTVHEVILATNPNMEGDATAMFITRQLSDLNLRITRLARGLPIGGDLEYADQVTLTRALEGRREVSA